MENENQPQAGPIPGHPYFNRSFAGMPFEVLCARLSRKQAAEQMTGCAFWYSSVPYSVEILKTNQLWCSKRRNPHDSEYVFYHFDGRKYHYYSVDRADFDAKWKQHQKKRIYWNVYSKSDRNRVMERLESIGFRQYHHSYCGKSETITFTHDEKGLTLSLTMTL